jgi:hypothetical protein
VAVTAAVLLSPRPTLAAGAGHDARPGVLFHLAQADAPAEQGAAPAAPAEAEPAPPIEPNAIAALERMGEALIELEQFGLTARITVEQVMDNGQKVQFGGTATYAVRRPDRFKVQIVSDTASRDVYYDGQELIVSDPATGYFAGAEAKPTIKETIAWAEETLGVDLPLAGLFDWGRPTHRSIRSPRASWSVRRRSTARQSSTGPFAPRTSTGRSGSRAARRRCRANSPSSTAHTSRCRATKPCSRGLQVRASPTTSSSSRPAVRPSRSSSLRWRMRPAPTECEEPT